MIARRHLLALAGGMLVGAAVTACSATETLPVVDPEQFGAKGGGTQDARKALQAAIDHAASLGGANVVLRHRFHVGGPLLARSGVTLTLERAGALVRTFKGGALVRNEQLGEKVRGFRIMGPGSLESRDRSSSGQMVFLYGDQLELADITIDTFSDGQAVLIGGDDVVLRRLRVDNAAPLPGVGGIRMFGGNRFRAEKCHVVAGDDALQFTPIATPGHPLADLSIRDSAYADCTGGSKAARFIAAILSTSPPGQGGLTASIENVAFIRCEGYGSNRTAVIANTDSSGAIRDVRIEDSDLDNGRQRRAEHAALLIHRSSGTGNLAGVAVRRTTIRRPRAVAFDIEGTAVANVKEISIEDSVLAAPGGGGHTLRAVGVDGLEIARSVVRGRGRGDVISLGSASSPVKNVQVSQTRISGIGPEFSGIRFRAVIDFKVSGCSFHPIAGRDGGGSVSSGSLTSSGTLSRNRYSGLRAPKV